MYDEEDDVIWRIAKEKNLVIVSKENDFQQLFLEKGFPPAVVKLSLGNCSNQQVKDALITNANAIKQVNKQYGLIIID